MPAISIIVPVYNVAQYLEQCIGCVFGQTFQDFEIIMVDDGSTDGSSELCDKIALTDSRIRVIHKANEGSGPTRTRGLIEAIGEYVAFADADDWFEPTMYQELYLLAQSTNADLVISAATSVFFDNNGKEIGKKTINCNEILFMSKEECRNGIMELFPTTTIFDVPWNKLYRRQVAVDNNLEFQRLRRCQDAVWNLDFYNHCSRVVSTSKAYYYYRENTQESTWLKFPKEYIDIQCFYFSHLRDILSSWGMYKGKIKQHYDTSFVLAIESCANMYDNPNWALNRAAKRDYVMRCMSRKEVRDFIPGAAIRKDCNEIFQLIKDCNVSAIMRRHRNERIKDAMRRNTVISTIWSIIKRLN